MSESDSAASASGGHAPNGLEVTGVMKSFGSHRVLDGIDLAVPAGSLTAVLGPSGSGKTTLLRIIAGFERADAGTVGLGGRVVDDGPARSWPPRSATSATSPRKGACSRT